MDIGLYERGRAECRLCCRPQPLMAETLELCPDCARQKAGHLQASAAHRRSRQLFDLPEKPPRTAGGTRCPFCANECVIGEEERGFCGLRTVRDGRLRHIAGTPRRGILHWYRDPLPTNCVADWVCPGSTQSGKHNLAVFYKSCTLDCLFCQNWHFRQTDALRHEGTSARRLADCAEPSTYCVCFFGGDPASQLPHALAAARSLAQRGVLVCWETAVGAADHCQHTIGPRLHNCQGGETHRSIHRRIRSRHTLFTARFRPELSHAGHAIHVS